MKTFRDYKGHVVRLTAERSDHILGHPELTGHEDWVANALLHPEEVRRSISDPSVMLFYQFRSNTIVGDKWFCVVAKYVEGDAFVVTAYLTDKLKKGDLVWRNP